MGHPFGFAQGKWALGIEEILSLSPQSPIPNPRDRICLHQIIRTHHV
ncbi:hypothetical protein [Nostoc sp.]